MAKTRYISLTYSLLFDKNENIWNNLYDFEKQLQEFFKEKGLSADVIPTVEGSSGNRIMLLHKDETVDKLDNKSTKGGVNSPKQLNIGNASKHYTTVNKLTNQIALPHGSTKPIKVGGKK